MKIERAKHEHAAEIAALLIRSIRELCGTDYGNDEAMLARWCAYKKPEVVER